jgi:hypothetical protein
MLEVHWASTERSECKVDPGVGPGVKLTLVLTVLTLVLTLVLGRLLWHQARTRVQDQWQGLTLVHFLAQLECFF